MAEYLAENVACAATERVTAGAKLEARAAWTTTRAALLAAEACEGIAAGALEPLEARLALGVDLAAIESGAALLVAQYLIGLVGCGEAVLGLGILGILVRMMLLGELALSRLYFLRRGVLANAQHLIGIAHYIRLRFLGLWLRLSGVTIEGSLALIYAFS
jgi:hypothetical protein